MIIVSSIVLPTKRQRYATPIIDATQSQAREPLGLRWFCVTRCSLGPDLALLPGFRQASACPIAPCLHSMRDDRLGEQATQVRWASIVDLAGSSRSSAPTPLHADFFGVFFQTPENTSFL